MPDFLADPPMMLLILLGIVFIICIAIWFSMRSRNALIAVITSAFCLGALILCDKLFESPREEAVRKFKALAEATRTPNPETLRQNISERFKLGSVDKAKLIEIIGSVKQIWSDWTGAEVWSFDAGDYQKLSDSKIKIGCSVQAKGFPQTIRYCVATFELEEKTNWRLTGMAIYSPIQKDKGQEEVIPELGKN